MSSVSVLTFSLSLEVFKKKFNSNGVTKKYWKNPGTGRYDADPGTGRVFNFHPGPGTGPGRDGGNPGPVPAGTKFRSRSTTDVK